MRLVQISDLHFGPQFQQEVFERAVEEINDIKPDVLVVTGDITENGIVREYEDAKKSIERIECERKVYCSGNHDYKSTGYLLFKRLFDPKRVLEFDNFVIATISTARPDRDEGEIGYRQLIWLQRTLSKHEGKKKIVAMHHHVVPVPDTGTDRITVLDAGDALRTFAYSNVDLVLCGHRHRPWFWRVERLLVVHAGTLSSLRTRGFFANTYNIIQIDDDSIKFSLKVVGGELTSFEEFRRKSFEESVMPED
ncbi:MAG: metallophosphoesterase [Nitrososphaerales archaeon]|nr:metallophosphoesterase [Nitrososphaerales archaeon]